MAFERIAFFGLGQMGRPMALNLLKAGFPVVGYDIYEPSRMRFVDEGGHATNNAKAAITDADCIVTMLPDSQHVRDALTAAEAARVAAPDCILVEMSSSAPLETRTLSEELTGRFQMIDAPVSGGVKRAVEGTLAIMVGGEEPVLQRALPVLEALSAKIIHCGPVGAGHAMKAINNYVSGAGTVAAIEGLRLATAFGLSAETVIDALNASSGKNNATEVKMKQFVLSESFASGFALGLMAKDIGIAAELSQSLGLRQEPILQTASLWAQAANSLGAAVDHTRIAEFLAKFDR